MSARLSPDSSGRDADTTGVVTTDHSFSASEHIQLGESFDESTYALIVSAVEEQDTVSIDLIVDRDDALQITDWLKETAWYSDLDADLPWVEDIDLYRIDRDG